MDNYSNVKKVCGFYVSNTHLVTMMLPYINKQMENDIKIISFFKYNLKEYVNKLLSKMIINTKIKENLLKLGWNGQGIPKYSKIEKLLKESLKNNKELEIIISGEERYINDTKEIIEKCIEKNIKLFGRKYITIISCYNVEEFNENIREILDQYDFIINTSGVHKIEDVFEGYRKKVVVD